MIDWSLAYSQVSGALIYILWPWFIYFTLKFLLFIYKNRSAIPRFFAWIRRVYLRFKFIPGILLTYLIEYFIAFLLFIYDRESYIREFNVNNFFWTKKGFLQRFVDKSTSRSNYAYLYNVDINWRFKIYKPIVYIDSESNNITHLYVFYIYRRFKNWLLGKFILPFLAKFQIIKLYPENFFKDLYRKYENGQIDNSFNYFRFYNNKWNWRYIILWLFLFFNFIYFIFYSFFIFFLMAYAAAFLFYCFLCLLDIFFYCVIDNYDKPTPAVTLIGYTYESSMSRARKKSKFSHDLKMFLKRNCDFNYWSKLYYDNVIFFFEALLFLFIIIFDRGLIFGVLRICGFFCYSWFKFFDFLWKIANYCFFLFLFLLFLPTIPFLIYFVFCYYSVIFYLFILKCFFIFLPYFAHYLFYIILYLPWNFYALIINICRIFYHYVIPIFIELMVMLAEWLYKESGVVIYMILQTPLLLIELFLIITIPIVRFIIKVIKAVIRFYLKNELFITITLSDLSYDAWSLRRYLKYYIWMRRKIFFFYLKNWPMFWEFVYRDYWKLYLRRFLYFKVLGSIHWYFALLVFIIIIPIMFLCAWLVTIILYIFTWVVWFFIHRRNIVLYFKLVLKEISLKRKYNKARSKKIIVYKYRSYKMGNNRFKDLKALYNTINAMFFKMYLPYIKDRIFNYYIPYIRSTFFFSIAENNIRLYFKVRIDFIKNCIYLFRQFRLLRKLARERKWTFYNTIKRFNVRAIYYPTYPQGDCRRRDQQAILNYMHLRKTIYMSMKQPRKEVINSQSLKFLVYKYWNSWWKYGILPHPKFGNIIHDLEFRPNLRTYNTFYLYTLYANKNVYLRRYSHYRFFVIRKDSSSTWKSRWILRNFPFKRPPWVVKPYRNLSRRK